MRSRKLPSTHMARATSAPGTSSIHGERTGTDTWYSVVRKATDRMITTGQYRTWTTVVDHGTIRTTASGPATISGSATDPISRATMKRRNAIRRVLTIPRTPSRPYMTVMVSMKTFTAREPDHRANRKPMEMTSGRPPFITSSRIGSVICLTPFSESTAREASRMLLRRLSVVSAPIQEST